MQDVPASWTSSPCGAPGTDCRHGEESISRKSDVVMRHAAVPAGLRPIAHGDISRGRRWRYSFDQGADYFDGDVAWVTPKGPLERKTDTSNAGCGTCRREGSPAPPPSFDPAHRSGMWPSRRARSRPTRVSTASSLEATPSPSTSTTGSRKPQASGSGTLPEPRSANSPVRRLRPSFYLLPPAEEQRAVARGHRCNWATLLPVESMGVHQLAAKIFV